MRAHKGGERRRAAPPAGSGGYLRLPAERGDSEKLRGYISAWASRFTDEENEADLIVVNTCAVREHAEMRVMGNVGALVHAKAKNPGLIVAVCGCMVQQPHMAEKMKKSFRVVDLVFGPHELWRFPELYDRARAHSGRVFDAPPCDGVVAEGLPVVRQGNVKAWLSIMNGCNNFCTYCVVPYVRGRERSRRPDDVLAEARQLVADGYKDIMLLGQNVNSYGRDLGAEGCDFPDLLRQVNAIPGDFVIRFMTSHPRDATEKLFRAMADCEKVERHIHLPVQSGSDRVLKAMNRHYDRAGYLALVDTARSLVPDIVLTTDIIVGFPGETAEEFDETLSLVERVRYDAMFTFIFSPRVGTPAAEMPDPARARKSRSASISLWTPPTASPARYTAAMMARRCACSSTARPVGTNTTSPPARSAAGSCTCAATRRSSGASRM